MISIKDIKDKNKWNELKVVTLAKLKELIDWHIHNLELNDISPEDCFVTVHKGFEEEYLLSGSYLSLSKINKVSLNFYNSNEIDYFEGEDKQPEGEGEYWFSRGIGYDLSGFVLSKEAGERLLTLVKGVLNNYNPKSWLDWRKFEPNWIQFKFQEEEFDLKKLDTLAKENNNILTYEILSECKI